jgi:hypothetical protein
MDTILFIIGMAFLFFLVSLMYAGFAKLTNTNLRHNGTNVHLTGPEDWDNMVRLVKHAGKGIGNLSKKTANKISSLKNNNSLDKTEKISQLSNLKKSGDLTEEEYKVLKKEILNS